MWRQWRRWIFYPVLWLLCMALPMAVSAWRHHSASQATVQGDSSFDVVSFDAFYQAERSGGDVSLQVTEFILADFGNDSLVEHHGIYRWLPTTYHGHDIGVEVSGVTDRAGQRVLYEEQRANGLLGLRIGSGDVAVHGKQTYVLRYRIAHAMLRDPNGHQEIYLNVNGTGWAQPMGSVSAQLQLPAELADHLDGTSACYRGAQGSTTRCGVPPPSASTRVSSTSIGAHQTLTLAIGFEPGTAASTIPYAESHWPAIERLVALPLLGLLLLALAWVLRRRMRRGAIGRTRGVQAVFQAPKDLPAIVAADFLGVPERGVAAELVDLVHRGNVRLGSASEPIGTSPQQRDGLSRRAQDDLRDDLRVWTTAQPFPTHAEKNLATALFGTGTPQRLDAASQHDLQDAARHRQEMYQAAMLREPGRIPEVLLAVGMAALLVGGWLLLHLGVASRPLFLLGGVVAVMLLVAAVHITPTVGRLTAAGRSVAQQLAGLRRFVLMAEADRLAWMQNAVDAPRVPDGHAASLVKIYEPLLPYAIIFGAEKTWIDLLNRLQPEVADIPGVDLSGLAWLTEAMPDLMSPQASRRWYSTQAPYASSWDNHSEFGHGPIAASAVSLSAILGSASNSSGRDSGSSGSSWGGGGSGSSSGGSSGGGSAGGGMGGGGGGGW